VFAMSKWKSGCERAQETKTQGEKDLLTKTHKLTSNFQVVDKDIGSSSAYLDEKSLLFLLSQTQSKAKLLVMIMMKNLQSRFKSRCTPVTNDVGLF